MTDHITEEKRNRAVLVGLSANSLSREDNASETSLEELEDLLETAGGECVGSVLQHRGPHLHRRGQGGRGGRAGPRPGGRPGGL